MERARNLAKQKPWIGLLVAAPVCLALLGTAFYQYREARAFGDEPQRLSVAAALARVSSENEPWVELADARFECAASVALGGTRYGRLRVDDRPVTVIAGFSGSDCPESGEPLVGVLTPLGERLMANRLYQPRVW